MTRYTLDTNIAVYAWSRPVEKAQRARAIVAGADFVSVQLLNEFAHVAYRKLRFEWANVGAAVADLRAIVGAVLPLGVDAHEDALRIASRYKLPFYDSLMLGVALSGGARTFYSEDMHHGLVIDDTLHIMNPFRPDAP